MNSVLNYNGELPGQARRHCLENRWTQKWVGDRDLNSPPKYGEMRHWVSTALEKQATVNSGESSILYFSASYDGCCLDLKHSQGNHKLLFSRPVTNYGMISVLGTPLPRKQMDPNGLGFDFLLFRHFYLKDDYD